MTGDVSVVICTRDRVSMLNAAVVKTRAVLPADAELLVVDSASKDPFGAATAAGTSRLIRLERPGLSIARNAGANAAREFIVFTDDDCALADQSIERITAPFADPCVAATTGRMIDEGAPIIRGPAARRIRRPVDGLDAGHGALMAFRRSALLEIGGFDPMLGAGTPLGGAEDLDAFCRILAAGHHIVTVPDAVVIHRNVRLGDAYGRLLRGYGRGLGAMTVKLMRVQFRTSAPIALRVYRRTVLTAVRALLKGDPRELRGALASALGVLEGVATAWRMPVDGQVFADPAQPRTEPAQRAAVEPAGRRDVVGLSPLDERFVASDLAAATLWLSCSAVVDGTTLRDSSGRITVDRIVDRFTALSDARPEFRRRLRQAPLGLMGPAWTDVATLDVAAHVKVHPVRLNADAPDPDVVSGTAAGPLDLTRPPWDILIGDLDDGDVLVVVRVHHAVGDGLYGRGLVADIFPTTSVERYGVELDRLRPPATLRIAAEVARDYARRNDGVRGAVKDWFSKPMVQRIRRVAGRNLRGRRNQALHRSDRIGAAMRARHAAMLVVDNASVKAAARSAGGSTTDVIVALTLLGLHASNDHARAVSVAVPIAAARDGREHGNNIRMARVESPAVAPLPDLIASVHAQISAAKQDASAVAGRTDGYATLMPGSLTKRYLLDAPVRSLELWPSLEPFGTLGVLAFGHMEKLSITLLWGTDFAADRFLSTLRTALSANEESR